MLITSPSTQWDRHTVPIFRCPRTPWAAALEALPAPCGNFPGEQERGVARDRILQPYLWRFAIPSACSPRVQLVAASAGHGPLTRRLACT